MKISLQSLGLICDLFIDLNTVNTEYYSRTFKTNFYHTQDYLNDTESVGVVYGNIHESEQETTLSFRALKSTDFHGQGLTKYRLTF